jgi:ATP-dependent helicase/nuclease subunit A
LKSPLFNLTEDELFTLAWNRKGTLREALTAHAADSGRFGGALERLAECERRFRTETPFAFYAWLLGGDNGRARILRRLGHEANDALDEFLELAMSYEKKAPASLQGFMAWLRAADTEVKRDMEISRDEVRVMTVHGAKGLEAAVVIMADTTTSPSDTQRLRLVHLPQGNGGKVMVWAGRKADDPRRVTDARNAMLEETEHEYRRLLYVAMTRAADRLIVAGCMPGNRNSVRENSWYDLVKQGLENSDLVFQEVPSGDGVVKSYRQAEDATPETDIARDAVTTTHPSLPEWLHTTAAPEQIIDRQLRPSDPGTDGGKSFRSGESLALRARSLLRGTLVHRLLQSLPDLTSDRRRDAALKYLARNADDWSDGDRETLAQGVLALIEDPRFAPVFGAGSRAEVAIAGRLARPGAAPALVSGQTDRLVVTPSEVLIVDFKTNHAPPVLAADAPAAYVRQLALYRAVLGKLYPQRLVRAALLWTETPELMEISTPALDAQLAGVLQRDHQA